MVRGGILALCAALAYVFLRGWPEQFPALMRACLAVLALVAGAGLWLRREVRSGEPGARNRRRANWLDYAAIGLAVLAVESGFLWLFGTAPPVLETVAARVEASLRPEVAAQRAIENGAGGGRPGNWLWTDGERRPLPRRTSFTPGSKPEVFIRPGDAGDAEALLEGRVYVRSFALAKYAEATWEPLSGLPLTLKPGERGVIELTAGKPGRAIRHEVFHGYDASGQNPLTGLQGAVAAEIGPLRRIDDGFHLLPPPVSEGGYQYHVTSTPLAVDDLPDGVLLEARKGAPDGLTDVAGDGVFRERVGRLAREVAGEGSVKEQLVALRDYLRSGIAYSLFTENRDDLDPIENFLFHEKRGHCEFFATSAALMVRSLGLPSRVAYGWAGGTWYESSGLFVFRANEAHAWTEIWLENYGWVVMDATPQQPGGERARVAPPESDLSRDLAESAGAEADEDGSGSDALAPIALGLVALFAVLAGGLGGLRFRRSAVEAAASVPRHSSEPVPGYWQAWCQACAAHGHPMPPGATLRRQIAKLPEVPDFAAELVRYHYATRYEGGEPSRATERRLKRRIADWRGGGS
ncbi:MAG: DUF4129 domain-containing transglutaminase family protein [Verrucomicrobiota bacterium JB025]|nr:transglutaminase domain-containing protein [Verrucomicrobiota bacterium JB025]